MSNISTEFCQIITTVLGERSFDGAGLHTPNFDHTDEQAVLEVVKSGWVSYQGKAVNDFEKNLENYLGVNHVIATFNGTVALFVVLKNLGIGNDDEVIVPALSFAATANAVVHAGATPHFVDVCQSTFAIDWDKLEEHLSETTSFDKNGFLINQKTGRVIKAMIPVHVLGASFDIKHAVRLAKKYNLFLLEDAAEALGSKYEGRLVGGISGVGVISFNGNKIITTGGGGAICVDDRELAEQIRHLVTTAKVPHPYEFIHDAVGYNFRLPALNAALGVSQLKRLESFLQMKRNLCNAYKEVFDSVSYGQLFNADLFGLSNCWLNAFILDKEQKKEKDAILQKLNDKKIFVRPLWKPLNTLEIFSNCPQADCSAAQDLYERVICLPSSAILGMNHEET